MIITPVGGKTTHLVDLLKLQKMKTPALQVDVQSRVQQVIAPAFVNGPGELIGQAEGNPL